MQFCKILCAANIAHYSEYIYAYKDTIIIIHVNGKILFLWCASLVEEAKLWGHLEILEFLLYREP